MDKPVSLSVKHWIIRQMSVRTMMQESLIETVVNHQFDSAIVALDTNNSLEFSGFGKLLFNVKKAYKKLDKMENQIQEFTRIIDDPLTNDIRRKRMEFKLNATLKNFNYLNTKLNGYKQDIRGMEESSFSVQSSERDNSEGE